MTKKLFPILMTATILAASCGGGSTSEKNKTGRTEFFDLKGMDSTVKASDDFFSYANGAWIKETKIPDDQKGWGSFIRLNQDNITHLHEIIEELSKKTDLQKGSLEQKVGDAYASGMDTIALEKLGIKPIEEQLKKIDAIKNADDLINYATADYKNGEGELFGFWVSADDKNSSMNIASLGQSETSLPEKSYYFNNDENTKHIREAFLQYVSTLFQLSGNDKATADKNAATVLKLETEIAKSHRSAVELRDPQKNYNKVMMADLNKISKGINWAHVFENMGVKIDSINVAQPDYYKALGSLIKSQPIDAWKVKMKFNYLTSSAPYLTKAFRDTQFEFYGKTLNGQKVQQPRWKQMTNAVDGGLGELAGQLYVKKYFTENAKKRMDELVTNIMTAYKSRLQKLDWMTDATKAKALEKLSTIMRKIGYPDKWKKYDDVEITRDNYFANVKSIQKHGMLEMLSKLGKPVDKTEWGMTPPTVNAYYNPSYNEIVFPAGILQWPFFDENSDDAINYGGIGMVIGHEITHGFDDQGRQYDSKGNMMDWWTKDDAEKFEAKTKGLINQYGSCKILGELNVNGELTLGENIADFGGLAIAYDAYKMTKQGQTEEKIDGFTGDQRFFLGFAQVWRVKKREELMRMAIKTDPHSPAMFRVNVPLMNFEPFYKAFNVKEGDKMYLKPEERAKIW
jgi:putative endopeptidase